MAETHRILGENAWVEFKSSGYPFKLRRELKETKDDAELLTLISKYVDRCHLPSLVEGNVAITHFSSFADLEEVDERFTTQLIWQFYDFRTERINEPLPKNS